MNPPLHRLLASLVLLTALRAQSPNPAEDIVSIKFRIMAWEGDIPALAFGHQQTVALTEVATRSDIQTYTGPSTLTFTLATAKIDPRKPAPAVASIVVPKNTSKITLLTAPLGHGRYGMYGIPEDSAILPPNNVRLHNLTNDRLLIAYNAGDQMELAPGASAIAVSQGKEAMVVRVARQVDGRWRELFNNVVELNATGGSNVMFIHGRQGAGLGMYALPAWPVEKTVETAGTQ
jgi:hypothetical protein